jgi:hypothetical protein
MGVILEIIFVVNEIKYHNKVNNVVHFHYHNHF